MEFLTGVMDAPPFAYARAEKTDFLLRELRALTEHHYEHCPGYKRILDVLHVDPRAISSVEAVPFIPVRLFKDFELMSVDRPQIVKTMTSSGTTGQKVSKIFLDRTTSVNQTKVLVKIVSSFIGSKRLPMLVIDSRAVIRDRNLFSARGAGILGFSMFGSDVEYALDDNMRLDLPTITAFLERHPDEPILLFGFTFMIWQHFWAELSKTRTRLPLDRGMVIHGGGWKKLLDLAVDNEAFRRGLFDVGGIRDVFNYYGMVEQTGSIFMECNEGHLHASVYSDIIIRDHRDFSVLPMGEEGLVQLLSVLPSSYPGHSILTEDVGRIVSEDDCPCGRKGKRLEIRGRVTNAEVRGCSDTYANV